MMQRDFWGVTLPVIYRRQLFIYHIDDLNAMIEIIIYMYMYMLAHVSGGPYLKPMTQ